MIGEKPRYGVLLFALLLLFYGAWAGLWWSGQRAAYTDGMAIWGIRTVELTGERMPRPFFDLAGVLSWRECRLKGVDVAATNPCDPMGRPANYPPLWQHLPLEWIGGLNNTVILGAVLGALFLLSLPWVLQPSNWQEFFIAAAACLSHVPLFAVERANVDLLIFLLMLAGVAVWRRGHNVAFLTIILLGGFLKLYPFALMAMFSRQRLRVFLFYAFAAAAALVVYAAATWADFSGISRKLPESRYFYDMFGAMLLPQGLTRSGALPGFRVLLAVSIMAGFWAAMQVARYFIREVPSPDWHTRRMALLLAGAIIMTSCFFLGANIDYRAIFLLACLPGLLALRRQTLGNFSKLIGWGILALLFCLYSEAIRSILVMLETALVGHEPVSAMERVPLVLCFLLREGVWWFLIVLLSALVMGFVRKSMLFRSLQAT